MKTLLLVLYLVAIINSYKVHVVNKANSCNRLGRYGNELARFRSLGSSSAVTRSFDFDFDYEAVYQDVLPNSKYRNSNLQKDSDNNDYEKDVGEYDDIAYMKGTQKPDTNQKDAIISTDSAVLVVAGPGAGKTRVLSARLAYLLDSAMCKPTEVLVISFTAGAADRIKARASDVLRAEKSVATVSGVNSDTFHGFCRSVVKKHYNLIYTSSSGAQTNIIIADDNDQKAIMLALLDAKGYPPNEASAVNILRKIRYWKELGLGYLGVRRQSGWSWTEQRAYELYPEYQTRLRSLSAVDFGDLQLHTLRLFRENPAILESYRARYKHILVDEFQDVSPAQYDILRMLVLGHNGNTIKNSAGSAGSSGARSSPSPTTVGADGGIGSADFATDADSSVSIDLNHKIASSQAILRVAPLADADYDDMDGDSPADVPRPTASKKIVNVFAAGDDDQSIYGWRGAQVELMRRFRFDFPGAKMLKFQVSYRMPDAICRVSNTLISPLSGRIHKSLRSSALSNVFTSNMKLLIESDSDGDFDFKESSPRTPIEARCMATEADELAWVCSYLRSQVAAGGPPSSSKRDYNIAVLTRTNNDFRKVISALAAHGLPYRERGYGTWQVPRGADSPLSFLRLMCQPEDNVAFQVAMDNDIVLSTLDKDEVKRVVMPRLRQIASAQGMSLLEASREASLTGQFAGKYALGLRLFILKYDALTANLQMYFKRGESGERTVYNTLQAAYQLRWSPELAASINELSRSVATHDTLGQFFESIRSEREIVVDEDAVVGTSSGVSSSSGEKKPVNVWAMAMHAAKGLEFDEVLLPFWTQGNVPKGDNAEERRLAFVSLTRARERVLISYSKTRAAVGAVPAMEVYPSPFISEMRLSSVNSMKFEDLSLASLSTTGGTSAGKRVVSSSIGGKSKTASSPPSILTDGSKEGGAHPFLSQDLKSYIDQKIDQKARSRGSKSPMADDALMLTPSVTPSGKKQGGALTAADIERLLGDSKSSRESKRDTLRAALSSDFGISRGSCEIDGKKKALSKCTPADLAAYLRSLLAKKPNE